jgi:acetolactate synthase-1/2/3 large subunit
MTINNIYNTTKCWENPKEPFLLNVAVDVHTNVYPKMLFGNPITEMEGEEK